MSTIQGCYTHPDDIRHWAPRNLALQLGGGEKLVHLWLGELDTSE